MNYDLKAFSRDLQDRLNWLFKEVVRLQEENDRLRKENEGLREEATLARLIGEMDEEERRPWFQEPAPRQSPKDLPDEALEFFRSLPDAFNFADYFEAADAYGVAANVARDWMLIYFREDMLEQRGRTIEKPNVPMAVRLVR